MWNFTNIPFVRALFFLVLIGATYLFFAPAELVSSEIFNWWDKAQHAVAFSTLTLLAMFAYYPNWKIIGFALILYGGAVELVQSFTTWRSGDIADWGADCFGVILIIVAYHLVRITSHQSNL